MTLAPTTWYPSAHTPGLLAVYARTIYEGGDLDAAPFKACYVQRSPVTDTAAGNAPQVLRDLCGVTNCEMCLAYVFQVERRRRGVGCWVTVDKDVNSYVLNVVTCVDPSLVAEQIALLLADRRVPVVRPLIVAA